MHGWNVVLTKKQENQLYTITLDKGTTHIRTPEHPWTEVNNTHARRMKTFNLFMQNQFSVQSHVSIPDCHTHSCSAHHVHTHFTCSTYTVHSIHIRMYVHNVHITHNTRTHMLFTYTKQHCKHYIWTHTHTQLHSTNTYYTSYTSHLLHIHHTHTCIHTLQTSHTVCICTYILYMQQVQMYTAHMYVCVHYMYVHTYTHSYQYDTHGTPTRLPCTYTSQNITTTY